MEFNVLNTANKLYAVRVNKIPNKEIIIENINKQLGHKYGQITSYKGFKGIITELTLQQYQILYVAKQGQKVNIIHPASLFKKKKKKN